MADDYYESPAYFRACQECYAYEFQTRMTTTSLGIGARPSQSQSDGDRKLSYRDIFWKNRVKTLSKLDVNDCRLFCWKDCAIYGIVQQPSREERFGVLPAVWREWYPHRAMDKDVDDESFFTKYMRFRRPVETLQEIYSFHLALCDKLLELESQMPDIKTHDKALHSTDPGEPPTPLKRTTYRLRPTFSDVFIVLEKGWLEQGVLLVWKNKDVADRHGCQVDADVQAYTGPLMDSELAEYDLVDQTLLDPSLVFRCSLERAMRIVVSTDPQRAVRRARYEDTNLIRQFGQGVDDV